MKRYDTRQWDRQVGGMDGYVFGGGPGYGLSSGVQDERLANVVR